ncbi:hypothetical protein EYA81_17220 [Bacteroides sp. A1C1]|uniref:hypothetical protein n=1 Tax=Bacteroides sp. A1C1 TaxID=2528203 RepID=UPI00103A4A09|nr:hypothetical protein [Bacteroides sp. A1C1]QBJ19940.1 hypothetical protein EYA81_17220 [Bacteroides sp. A1C1]
MVEINFDKLDRTLVLAELSCNHLQSFDIAVRTIEAMKKAGADVVKVQIWGIERSGFFNGREKWAKGFENQRV